MATVLDISMALDGFVAGPNDGLGKGLGDGGRPIHNWVMGGEWSYGHETFSADGVDRDLLDAMRESVGAAIVGRRMFDVVDGWGGESPWGIPVFVLTHRADPPGFGKSRSAAAAADREGNGGAGFTFVRDGVIRAHERAVEAAGEKDVVISGGANVAQQFLAAGLVDELQLHIAPVLIGDGVRLFAHLARYPLTLIPLSVAQSARATHVRYSIDNPDAQKP